MWKCDIHARTKVVFTHSHTLAHRTDPYVAILGPECGKSERAGEKTHEKWMLYSVHGARYISVQTIYT